MLSLAGCSLLPTGGAVEQTVPHPTQIGNHNGTGNATRGATKAEVLAAKVRESLAALGAASKAPSREQMVAAMLDAGAAKDAVEVSIDRTPTGLAVDAIEAAALLGGDCVIGQVRTGKAVVVILPVLASGRCFVGDQH